VVTERAVVAVVPGAVVEGVVATAEVAAADDTVCEGELEERGAAEEETGVTVDLPSARPSLGTHDWVCESD